MFPAWRPTARNGGGVPLAQSLRALILLALAGLGGCGPAPTLAGLDLDSIRLPPGFHIGLYAAEVPNARSLALGERGTLFVGTRTDGRVLALRDGDGDGRAEARWTLARDLDMPNGVAFHAGSLYVAESGRVLRFDRIEDRLDDPPPPVTVAELPAYRHHGWRELAVGPDGKLYIAMGAPCNVCEPDELGSIWRLNLDGTGREIYARGVRNSVGLAWHPETRELWFTDNGRDWLGDESPPDELNRASAAGQHFGFPYCHGGDVPDPELGTAHPCGEFVPPVQRLGAHVASLGLLFLTGGELPAAYRGQVLIAEHGSWNRSTPVGYRISLVRLAGNQAVAYEPFATGWLNRDGSAWGRPVDLLQLPDGSLLVSDDRAEAIYRIHYRSP